MNKKLLVTAVGAALAGLPAVATYAQVKVGGHAQVEYYQAEAKKNTTAGNGALFSGSGLGSTTASTVTKTEGTGLIDNARGRFWITAEEDLGGGMKGLAHFEFSVDTANSGQAATAGNSATPYDPSARTFDARTREKFVGLAGGFGAVKFGNQHGTYKRLGGVRWDPFNATVLEARGNGGQSGSADVNASFAHNGFIPGAIKYESGKAFGDMVYFEALYAPHKNDTSPTGDTGTGNDYQLGVSIKPIKDLEIIAAYSNNKKQPSSANQDQKAKKLGARYSFLKDHTVWLQWEDVDINDSATTGSVVNANGITTTAKGQADYLWLGYQFRFGNNRVVAQYGKHERDITGTDVETTYMNLGYIYNFSRTTSAWAGYRKTEAEQGTTKHETTVFALGMRKDF